MDRNELSKLIYVQISVFTHCLGRYYVSSKLKNTRNYIETRQDDIRKKMQNREIIEEARATQLDTESEIDELPRKRK